MVPLNLGNSHIHKNLTSCLAFSFVSSGVTDPFRISTFGFRVLGFGSGKALSAAKCNLYNP